MGHVWVSGGLALRERNPGLELSMVLTPHADSPRRLLQMKPDRSRSSAEQVDDGRHDGY